MSARRLRESAKNSCWRCMHAGSCRLQVAEVDVRFAWRALFGRHRLPNDQVDGVGNEFAMRVGEPSHHTATVFAAGDGKRVRLEGGAGGEIRAIAWQVVG